MEDNEEVAAFDETFKDVKCSIKIEQDIDQNEEKAKYFDFNLGADLLDIKSSKPHRRKQNLKLLDTQLQSPMFAIQTCKSNIVGQILGLKYRPIRPKPYASSDKTSILKRKLIEVPPTMNMSTSSSSSRLIIASLPSKEKIQGINISGGTLNNEISKCIDGIGNSNIIKTGKYRRDAKTLKKHRRTTIELFFDSMAQAVLKLPAKLQAEIKMEICKLVTMAEINYYGSQSR